MNRAGKAYGGAPLGIWSGLLFTALALAGLVLTGVARPEETAAEAQRARGHDTACPPEADTAARTADGPDRDHNHLTPAEAAELDRRLNEALVTQQAPAKGLRKKVPTVVHVISASDGRGDLSDSTISRQINTMNKGFSGGYGYGADTGFRFKLRAVTRTVNDSWFEDFGEHESTMKEKLRRGDADTLNLYMLNLPNGMLGRSTFPQDYEKSPELDGVVVDYRTVPGGEREKFNLGFTAVHETGHWLGLFHTFQNGCEHPGDYVDDTPFESKQAAGCPEGRDTCDQTGRDPVHNFMNYSDDPCMSHFTRGQRERMTEHWAAFRA
ncbi:zinc metalloprotease [Nocardiopsis gilva YIM 90087]|uniref:Zinc metalloprotease n=1 Tax=Nocardiopsis gilva YIM 90087 TaxID=1235441 RepID=A0A223SE85_9ACTN|nr:zinc metalloprotease [Nocardiopsis gilva]ASU86393.1 zinc metalloprotease [Nocardiopsis gilva YIM 90087]